MNDIRDVIECAVRFRHKLVADNAKPETADRIRDLVAAIEARVRDLEDVLRDSGFVWVTDENLVLPESADDVPEPKGDELPFEFPATCPYCGAFWRFSDSATETFSIRLNMCSVPQTVVICPGCRKRSMIVPKGKIKVDENNVRIGFAREGCALTKVD